MDKRQESGAERRRYIRLSTVFPVEFEIVSSDGKEVLSEFHQSFTRDVSEGGICLEINNLKDELAGRLNDKTAKMRLQINVPFSAKPIAAEADAAWLKKIKEDHPNKFLIGISYKQIADRDRKRIVNFARFVWFRQKAVVAAVAVLAIAIAFASLEVSKKEALRREAEKKLALVEKERTGLSHALEDLKDNSSALESKLKGFEEERTDLEKKLEAAKAEAEAKPEEIAKLESELLKAQTGAVELNKELERFTKEKKRLEDQLKIIEEIKASRPVKVNLAAGGVVIGKVVLESADSVRVEVPTGVITLKRNLIASMTTPSDKEIAELAKERLKLEERALSMARKKEIERQRLIEEQKEEQVKKPVEPKETGKPGVEISKRIEEKGVVAKGTRVYVDGKLFFIKGVAYGISAPGLPPGVGGSFSKIPMSVFENDFSMMKESGINTIRTYEPLPDALLDLAEKYDIKIIEQIVSPSSYTDYSSDVELKTLKKIAVETVKKHSNRKCILMWLIWNDAPFCYEEPGSPIPRYGFDVVNKFMKEIYLAVKEADKAHPVTAANVLNVEGYNLGFDFLDVIGCNAYIGGHGFGWGGAPLASKVVNQMADISKKFDKPVIITETGFSTFVKKAKQDDAIEVQIKAVGEKLTGIVIFEWIDEWWKGGNPSVQDKHIEEYWGILTWDRKPKPGYEVVARLFKSIPTDSLGYSEKKTN
jgi:hypothetical protein